MKHRQKKGKTMTTQSVAIQRNNVIPKWDMENFKSLINRKAGLKKYDGKKIVSFYDDDMNCDMVLRIPYTNKQLENGDFDNKMMYILDVMADYVGSTSCKFDGQFL